MWGSTYSNYIPTLPYLPYLHTLTTYHPTYPTYPTLPCPLQAIKALKEEGIEVVLINPNVATVQTSKSLGKASPDKARSSMRA